MDNCKYCGSSKHPDINCRIKLKADALVAGVPVSELFDVVLDGIDDTIDFLKSFGPKDETDNEVHS